MIRVVLDTNILVRATIKPTGTVGPVLDELVQRRYLALFCSTTLEELRDVLGRPRLRRRFPITDQVCVFSEIVQCSTNSSGVHLRFISPSP